MSLHGRHPHGDSSRRQTPFRSLHDASGATLAARLQHEHPQTVAVVVSQLPPENGADLLASLPSHLQAEVARRLVDLEEADPEVLYEIERGLESWLYEHEKNSHRRSVGMRALENILAAADPLTHESVLANLARHDGRLAAQLTSRHGKSYSFAELNELDDASLAKVLAQTDSETLLFALAGAGKTMVARAHRVLPVARAARLRRDLDRMGPARIADIESAQQTIADIASDLQHRGELSGAIGRKLSLAV